MIAMQAAITEGPRACDTERAAQRRLETRGYAALKAIKCRFRSGTILLTGDAPSYFHKQLAQEAVRTLAAVRAINNQISVIPPAAGRPLRTTR